jgi:hypothetical protein
MSAGCYLCELKLGTIPLEEAGDAVGGCRLCGVFACRGHAIRDPKYPRFVCGVCLPNLLAAAAAKVAGTGGGSPKTVGPRPPDGKQPPGMAAYDEFAGDIQSVEDVISDFGADRWKAIRNDVDYLARFVTQSDAAIFRPFARVVTSQAALLMAAAIALATYLRLPEEQLIPALRESVMAARQHV